MRALVGVFAVLSLAFVVVGFSDAQARHVTGTCVGLPIDVMIVADESGSMTSGWDGSTRIRGASVETQRFLSLLRTSDQSGAVGSGGSYKQLDGNHAATINQVSMLGIGGDSRLDTEITKAQNDLTVYGNPSNSPIMVVLGDDSIGLTEAQSAQNQGTDMWIGYFGRMVPPNTQPHRAWIDSASDPAQAHGLMNHADLRAFFSDIMGAYGWHQQSDPPENLVGVKSGPVPYSETLTWEAPEDDECLVYYNIYRDGGVVASVPKTQLWYVDALLCKGHDWTVTAVYDNEYESTHSNEVIETAEPLGTPVASFREEVYSPDHNINAYDHPGQYETFHEIGWTFPDDQEPCVESFEVQRDSGAGFDTVADPAPDRGADGLFNNERLYQDPDYAGAGTTCGEYRWRVRAQYETQGTPWHSDWSNVVVNGEKGKPEASVLTVSPSPLPSNPGAPLYTASEPELKWNRPEDHACPIQEYEIQRLELPSGSWATIATTVATDPTEEKYVDHNTPFPPACVAYRVRAHNDIGAGPWSNVITWHPDETINIDRADVTIEACPSWWISHVAPQMAEVNDIRLNDEGRAMAVGMQVASPLSVPLDVDPYWRGLAYTGSLAAQGVVPLPPDYEPLSIDFSASGNVYVAGMTDAFIADIWVTTPSGGMVTHGHPSFHDHSPIVRVGRDAAHPYVLGYTSYTNLGTETMFAAPGMTTVAVDGQIRDFEIGRSILASDKFNIVTLTGGKLLSIGVPSGAVFDWGWHITATDLAVQWSSGDVHVVSDVPSDSPRDPMGVGFQTTRIGDSDIRWHSYDRYGSALDERYFGTCGGEGGGRVSVTDTGLLALGATTTHFIDVEAPLIGEAAFCAHTPRAQSISSYHQAVGPSSFVATADGGSATAWYVAVITLEDMSMKYGSFAGTGGDILQGIHVTSEGRLYGEGVLALPSTPFSYSFPDQLHMTYAGLNPAVDQFRKVMHFGFVAEPTCDSVTQSLVCGTPCNPLYTICHTTSINCSPMLGPGMWPVEVACLIEVCESVVLGTCVTSTPVTSIAPADVFLCNALLALNAVDSAGCVAACLTTASPCATAFMCTSGWVRLCVIMHGDVAPMTADFRVCTATEIEALSIPLPSPGGGSSCITPP